jgi:hypothetical protein
MRRKTKPTFYAIHFGDIVGVGVCFFCPVIVISLLVVFPYAFPVVVVVLFLLLFDIVVFISSGDIPNTSPVSAYASFGGVGTSKYWDAPGDARVQ